MPMYEEQFKKEAEEIANGFPEIVDPLRRSILSWRITEAMYKAALMEAETSTKSIMKIVGK